MVPRRLSATSEWNWTSLSWPLTARSSLKWTMNKNFVPSTRSVMATEVAADALGKEWKGYVVRISGGNNKQGFPMKQGVLTHGQVCLLLSKGHSCYRPRRTGERKRKSERGCIMDANLSVLNLVIVNKGEKDIPGLTDTTVPHRLGPKRASRIRKPFNLSKEMMSASMLCKSP